MPNEPIDSPVSPNMSNEKNSGTPKVIAATVIGIIFIVVLLLLALFVPEPTKFQYEIFRVVLALAAAGFAAILPGAISAKLPWGIGAVGSLAVFSIVYFFSPAQLVAKTDENGLAASTPTPAVTSQCPDDINEMEVFLQSLPTDYQISSKDVLSSKLGELFNYKVNNESALSIKNEEISRLTESMSNRIEPGNIEQFVRNLEPDDPLGKKIKLLSVKSEGPWRPSTKARSVEISVPGKFAEGKNYSCPKYFGENVEFRSNLVIGDELLSSQPSVTLKINGTLSSASNCEEIISYDFQLSCIDARKIYSSKVLDCDENNNPLWKVDKSFRIMPAYATVIYKAVANK